MIEIVIGLIGGIFIGATGAGVGLLVSPLLILAGYRPSVAVGTGVGVLVAAKLVGSLSHSRLGHWPGRTTWFLLLGGAGGVLLAWTLVTRLFPVGGAALDSALRRPMAFALLTVPFLLVFSSRKEGGDSSAPPRSGPSLKLDISSRPSLLFAVGLALGAPVFVTSLGSGSLLVPALALSTEWEVPQLAAASNWFGFVVGMMSAGAHAYMGNLQAAGFGKVALGIVPGVLLGVFLSRHIQRSYFVLAMAGMSLLLGLWLLLS
jgi:uncharacterized membrane protein YfcA